MVFLPVLAAEIPLRCAWLRREARELLRLDTVCSVRSWKLPGRMAVQFPAATRPLAGLLQEVCAWSQRSVYAGGHAGPARTGRLGAYVVQHRIFLSAVLVRSDHDPTSRYLSVVRSGFGGGFGRLRRGYRRRGLWRCCRFPAGTWFWIRNIVFYRWNLSPYRVSRHSAAGRQDIPSEDSRFIAYIESRL